ncbi:type IV pilus modification protein PilV [Thauera humireducens]|uniref:type IV pilus modification protein PilV n=1 Tax=Thauera humireducens TaxID=1134435 RepID=UPI00311E8B61
MHTRPRPYAARPPPRENGTTLIEALVAMVVLSVGVLGMVGLQANALKLNQTSLQRSQATILAYAILDQMRSDTAAARAGDYDVDIDDTPPTAIQPSHGTTNSSARLAPTPPAASAALPRQTPRLRRGRILPHHSALGGSPDHRRKRRKQLV